MAVKDKRVLATGYNGAPSGLAHCLEAGCLRQREGVPSGQRHELCRGLHAEQNLIIQAALHGVALREADVYCTHQPCSLCAKMLANARISKVVYRGEYPDPMTLDIFAEAGITLQRFVDEVDTGSCDR